jgi:hypothetical protein
LASIYLDSRFPGSEGAIIQLDTGNAQIKQRASMIPYDNEYISLSVPSSFVYLDSGSGGLAQVVTSDTTYHALGDTINVHGGDAYLKLDGNGGANLVDIIAGTTDSSTSRIIMYGSAVTTTSIHMIVDAGPGAGAIDIDGGFNTGTDVPIRVTTRNTITLLGRPVIIDGDATVTGAFGCNGALARTAYAVGVDATDLTSALILVNNLKTALVNNGIAVTA